jgi:hypothetical protein
MKKFLIIIFIALFFSCSNDRNPFSPSYEKSFFNEQLLPYLGKKNCSITFMLYLNGANNLETASLIDFYYELSTASLLSKNKEITVIVLYDRISGEADYDDWTGTRLYKITKFGLERLGNITINGVKLQSTGDNEDLDMSDYKTLQDFVKYAMLNYPADFYILDIWNHGDGWRTLQDFNLPKITKGVSWDEESGNNYLKVYEIRQALENVGKKIDIIYFDACLMQMVEVAYELRNVTDYIVASENLVPGNGANYIDVFEKIRKIENNSSFNIALALFNSYKEQYNYEKETCFSIVETKNINQLISAINIFANNLTNKSYTIISNARKNTTSPDYATNGHYYYADLYSFAKNISNVNGAIDVMNSIQNVVKANYYYAMNEAYGLSIYFPDIPDIVETDYTNYNYGLSFLKDCNWRNFIKWYKNR